LSACRHAGFALVTPTQLARLSALHQAAA
jgi:hypothetical protein